MAQYPFLSDEWLVEAKKIRAEYEGKHDHTPPVMKMNQIVTDVPFGDGTIEAHLDTSDGEARMDVGHLDDADLTVTLDYATAKAILVDQDPQAGMQAFMSGQIKVAGDMTKMMAFQAQPVDEASKEMAARIQEITE